MTCHERYLSDAQRDPAAMRRWQLLLDDFYLPQQVRPPRAPSSVSRYSVSRNTHTPICQDRLGTTEMSPCEVKTEARALSGGRGAAVRWGEC